MWEDVWSPACYKREYGVRRAAATAPPGRFGEAAWELYGRPQFFASSLT